MNENKQEQHTEKNRIIENHLPSIQSIIEEYQAQGKTLTLKEAEQIREEIRKDMTPEDIDAMENILEDDVLEQIAGGAGGSPIPTACPVSITPEASLPKLDIRPF